MRKFTGMVFRHMFAGISPLTQNTRGARWNPPDVAAIYASISRQTALAEAEWRLSMEPVRPRTQRTLYSIEIALSDVLDLSSPNDLAAAGVNAAELASNDPTPCRLVGGAVAWLGHDGLLVPSARHPGTNIVIFATAQDPDGRFEVVDAEEIND